MIHAYLFFKGNCREAMKFYQSCFGGDLQAMTYGEGPKDACPAGAKDRIMHAALRNGELMIMASDFPDDSGPVVGTNISLSLTCKDVGELEHCFQALSEGGKVFQPLHDAFWGDRFGMLTDRYGFQWMLTCPLKK